MKRITVEKATDGISAEFILEAETERKPDHDTGGGHSGVRGDCGVDSGGDRRRKSDERAERSERDRRRRDYLGAR